MKLAKLAMLAVLIAIFSFSASALGVTPSRVIVDFTNDTDQEINFNIINNEAREFDVRVYARGRLAEYVAIEKEIVRILADQKETKIRYRINVPYSEREPGINTVEIVVEEMPSASSKGTVVMAKAAVVHQLYLKSPFEGKYARAVFTTNNPDEGEELLFTYAIFNEGTEAIDSFNAELEVYTAENELIGKMNYEFKSLLPGEHIKEVKAFNQQMPPGEYTAKTKIRYGEKELLKEAGFIVGGAYIEVEEIKAMDFKLGGINKLDFYLYNKFFSQLDNVFAEIIVKDKKDRVYSIFRTVSVDLPPFTAKEAVGYWDTKGINIGEYSMLIKVNYKGRTSEEEFDIKVLPNELISSKITGQVIAGEAKVKNPVIPILTLAFIILVIINILLVIYIKRNKKPPEPINSFIILLLSALSY